MLAEIWRATAIVLVILVAGMQLIPKEYDEAAEVFGARPGSASSGSRCRCCKPSLQTALILRTVLAFEVFAVVSRSAARNFPVLVGETYNWQNDQPELRRRRRLRGAGHAISLAATAVYLRVLRVRPEQLT